VGRIGGISGRFGRWVAAAGGLLLIVAAERADLVGRLRAAGRPERIWLWAAGDPRDARPVAFYAVRDFALAHRPERATVEVLGDEEYILSVNGHRIGSNRYASGSRLDRYEVSRRLAEGRNRVVIELRSATAAGGFTLRLVDGEGDDLLEAAPPWEIHRSYFKSLFAGGRTPPGESPVTLGRSPLGRWGTPGLGPLRPEFEELLAAPRVVPAVRYRRLVADAQEGGWHRLRSRTRRRESLGPAVEFDFGGPVTGYLQLEVRGRAVANGLLRYSLEAGGPAAEAEQSLATTLPHRGLWQEGVARRFRFVEVLGLEGVTGAGLLPLVEDAPERLGRPIPSTGLLGILAPPLRAPVEDVIRRELERAPGLAVGEGR